MLVSIRFRRGVWRSDEAEKMLRDGGWTVYGPSTWRWVKGRVWLCFRVAPYTMTGSDIRTVEWPGANIRFVYLICP
jgi:hypothetical protein